MFFQKTQHHRRHGNDRQNDHQQHQPQWRMIPVGISAALAFRGAHGFYDTALRSNITPSPRRVKTPCVPFPPTTPVPSGRSIRTPTPRSAGQPTAPATPDGSSAASSTVGGAGICAHHSWALWHVQKAFPGKKDAEIIHTLPPVPSSVSTRR